MNEDDKLRLRGNYEYLVENIRTVDIQDNLVQEFILSDEENEKLSNIARYETNSAAVRKLLQFLLQSPNQRTYTVLCDALNAKGYDFVVNQLSSTDVSKIKAKIVEEKKQQDDQLEKLQKQTWMQYEMLVDMKKQLDEYKEKQNTLLEKEKKYSQFDELEVKMKLHGLSSDHVVNVLLDYMDSGGFSPSNHDSHAMDTDGSAATSEQQKSTSKPDISKPPQDSKKLAREIGKDIAFYMVMIKNNIKPVDAPNKYAVVMRNMVDELNERHEEVFMTLVGDLDLDKSSGFQALFNNADALFSEGANNWGRIVVLYAYGGWMAVNSGFDKNNKKSWEKIAMLGDILGYYVGEKLDDWIKEAGGWVRIVKYIYFLKLQYNLA